MSFAAFNAALSGNPIGAGFSIFSQLVTLFSGLDVSRIVAQLQFYRSSFETMGERGLFGSQVQRRGVEDRSIWEQIGYDAPDEVPPIWRTTPPGATFTVKDTDAQPANSQSWIPRGRGRDFIRELRWPDGAWFGSLWSIRPGNPPDIIPRVGSDGVHRVDFPPDALQRAQDAQPREYLGPRPLAGAEMAARRAAFAAGGGNVALLWMHHLNTQARREGRPVRAWTGNAWVKADPNREAFDSRDYSRPRVGVQDARPELFSRVSVADAAGLSAEQGLRLKDPLSTRRRLALLTRAAFPEFSPLNRFLEAT